ncbi:ATP-binding protein [Campylobacter sp.]|uniref:sensor histidine kinase n=1 Tax=Campylobacter sp. TaxID=205 RepID=UPI0025B85EC0|nr:ATP-binding protein [Campylobacter sp.]
MKIPYDFTFKIYIVIALFSLFIIFLGINIYTNAKNQMINILDKEKAIISQNIVEIFQFWVDERINSLKSISKFIEIANINDTKIKKPIKIFLDESKNFDLMQFLSEDGEIYINDILYDKNKEYNKNLIWYIDTKINNSPTVNFIPNHTILKEKTLNLCVPNYKNSKFFGVLCGVVKLKNIFQNINNFKLPLNSYSFIITNSGEILTPMKDQKLKEKIQKRFTENFLIGEDSTKLAFDSNFISLSEIPYLNWFIGAGTDNSKEIDSFLTIITKNALILLISFILLAFIANFLHNFMYRKIKNSKEEIEVLLAHKAKMSETGELIAGINHQFINPVNSLNLMISTLIMLNNDDKLDKTTLFTILKKGQKSISLLNSTIEIFRNFYKTSENIKIFNIKQSILNLLTLMHTELARANINVALNDFEDKRVEQIENIIQQILLILIHNAKDAIIDKFKNDIKNRKIQIDVSFDNKKAYIKVIDFGSGVSKIMGKKIFSHPKTTKKYGNGIGLYFGKKLANEKINGDIKLINYFNPTIFQLEFDINLKDKNDK